jgi:hypothetical protein
LFSHISPRYADDLRFSTAQRLRGCYHFRVSDGAPATAGTLCRGYNTRALRRSEAATASLSRYGRALPEATTDAVVDAVLGAPWVSECPWVWE